MSEIADHIADLDEQIEKERRTLRDMQKARNRHIADLMDKKRDLHMKRRQPDLVLELDAAKRV